jgi:RHS repeat-associated protein
MRISSTAGGSTSRFVVDANRQLPTVLAELDGTGQVRADYTYGGNDLLSQARGGATSYYLADAQGSTRALLDASGATIDTYNYDAFGNLASSTGTTSNDYLFTGQQLDRGLGLYNLRAREYSPSIGRLTTRDTWAGSPMSPLTLNKYGYANADPVNRIDPTGNQGVLEFSVAINLDAILIGMLLAITALILVSIYISLYQSHMISTITLPSLGTTLTSTAAGTQAIAQARTEARTKVEEAERTNPGCGGNLLYHYTGQAAATSIEAEQSMWLTRQWTDPTSGNVFPRGVYATDIPPWAVMTQAELAKVFYFSARRQAIADLSWVVVICNDVPPPFIPLGAGQWVKADGNVHVIAILPNPMP